MSKIEVVINACYGGFGLSEKALNEFRQRKNNPNLSQYRRDFPRHDPILVDIVKNDPEASGKCSKLEIVEIDSDFIDIYAIDEYDGYEGIKISTKKFCDKLLTFDDINEMKKFIEKVNNF